jgi:hypothetical protein
MTGTLHNARLGRARLRLAYHRPEVDVTTVLAAIAGCVAMAALAYGCYRWAMRFHESERRFAARVDEAMAAVARELGLAFYPGVEESHPVVGAIRSYGEIRGPHRGRSLTLIVQSQSTGDGHEDFTVLEVRSPTAAWSASAAKPNDDLRRRAAELVIQPSLVRIVPRSTGRSWGAPVRALLTDVTAIRKLIDDAMDLCDELDRRSSA